MLLNSNFSNTWEGNAHSEKSIPPVNKNLLVKGGIYWKYCTKKLMKIINYLVDGIDCSLNIDLGISSYLLKSPEFSTKKLSREN